MNASPVDPLLEDADATRLSFDSHQEAIDYVLHLKECANRWLSRERIDLAKRYENCELEIVVKFMAVGHDTEFQLIFRAIPPGRDAHSDNQPRRVNALDLGHLRGDNRRDSDFVFCGIGKMVYGPKQVIPPGYGPAATIKSKISFGISLLP